MQLFDETVTLPERMAGTLDHPCLIGIRPEDVRVALDEIPGSVPMELDAVTPLNVHTVLFLRARDKSEVLATCSEGEGLRFGRDHRHVFTRIDPSRALFFDQSSGECLNAAA